MATCVMPLSDAAHLMAGRSSHPTLLARARGRAVLAPDAPYGLARLVEELRGHRPVADPRGVSLGDADHVLQMPRGDAGAHDRPPDRRVGRGDEGIGPVVVVQERRLPAFEQDPLSVLQRLLGAAFPCRRPSAL